MVARLVVIALVALLAGGCAPVASSDPSQVSVDVTQGRTDRDGRVIVLDVTNTGSTPIDLVQATLVTTQFAEHAEWTRGTTLGPGRTVSLRAPLGDPVCPKPAESGPIVAVDYVDADGAEHSVDVEPTQSTDVLALIEQEDCFAVFASRAADIRVADSVSWTPGAHEPAELQVLVSPAGGGAIEIVEARSTILLGLLDDTGAKVEAYPIGMTVDAAAGEQQITLRLVPNRCDPHAIAEDKRGTIMILALTLEDGTAGVGYYRSSDEVKSSLFDFVSDYCVGQY